jgi:CRP-like cAMP-binding protein
VAYLSKGKSFGELAIMQGSSRTATVISHTDVTMLSIGRDEFIDIFMHVEQGKEPEHILFLKKIEILSEWPIDLLPHNNPQICVLSYFRKGTVMCKNSLDNDWIYIVKQGVCKVIKSVKTRTEQLYLEIDRLNSKDVFV